jgi:hypothetical protein
VLKEPIRNPPEPPAEEFDRRLDRFERLSGSLVLLDDRPFDRLRREIHEFSAALTRHVEEGLPRSFGGRVRPGAPPGALERLLEEHERFRGSVVELRGLLDVVGRDDHGGHRQALGQYGRVLAEALRRHRAEERTLEALPAGAPPRPEAPALVANRKEVPREPADER